LVSTSMESVTMATQMVISRVRIDENIRFPLEQLRSDKQPVDGCPIFSFSSAQYNDKILPENFFYQIKNFRSFGRC
ncbi:MAG TPA: hypothetical protein VNX00_01150, partial [Herbaspirillum sp.]|nr:hypothetical protein [Herbaspirillum sp.]